MDNAQAVIDRPDRFGLTQFDLLRTVVAVILLIAAVFKAWQLATEPLPARGILDSHAFRIAEVEFELALALWLLSGLLKWHAWLTTLCCFALFSAITLYKGLIGASSCGCFGSLAISPWYTLMLDLTIVSALAFSQPARHLDMAPNRPTQRAVVVTLAMLILGLPAALASTSYQSAVLTSAGQVIGDNTLVLLEPETWIDRPFPLLDYIDQGDQLAQGDWIAILYRHDCPVCHELIPQYDHYLQTHPLMEVGMRFALIEVPQMSAQPVINVPAKAASFIGRLHIGKKWFVETPVVLGLSSGHVIRVSSGARQEEPPEFVQALIGMQK